MTSTFEAMDRLDGRVAVIAGGTGAIGMASAHRLAALGATCVLLYARKTAQEAQALANSLPGNGHIAIQAHITNSATLQAAAAQVHQQFGQVHILVNSAGHTKAVTLADLDALSDEVIDDILQVNFRGVMATIRVFVPLLKASGDGLIVNISSIAGFTGVGSNLAYVAAKAGLDVVGDSLARILAPAVRVITVSPGVVDSSFVPGRGADFNEKAAATIPLKRIGHVEDTASAIEACATTMRFATGSRFVVDGGRSL